MLRVLHLSDIHIGKTYKDPQSIAYKIATDIAHNGLTKINCIVVTGDVFEGKAGYSEELVENAINFFDKLVTQINYNQENYKISKEDVIFVPGNHDLIRDDDHIKRWSKYKKFLEKFYGDIPDCYDKDNYSVLKKYSDHKVIFAGFNSCEIEKNMLFDDNYISKFDKYIDSNKLKENNIEKEKIIDLMKNEKSVKYDDYGYISVLQLAPMVRKLRNFDDYRVIALFHHHFYLFPEIAQKFGDSSLIRNYTEVMQYLKYMNVSIVMHGHKHFDLERPFITEDYYESTNNIIDVFAGGSVGTDRKEEHTFSILDIYEKNDEVKLKHYKFIYKDEELQPIKIKQVPPLNVEYKVVKLLENFKKVNYDKYNAYIQASEKSFKSYDICNNIITWVSKALTGFTDVSKYFDNDNCILFLLFAINYRTICYMNIVGNEELYFKSASKIWDDFYDENLSDTDFFVKKEEYKNIFKSKKLIDVAKQCDKVINMCENKNSKIYLAFTMLGIFFADLYLILTKYADNFKDSIQYKVNIKIEDNKFHENVPAPHIVISSDADRRSVYIELLCNEATAHKMAVLFVKEFDLLISKFEDYFKIIGLKFYYLIPKINKDRMKNKLDNYNFEAYIPTLIPLLTGDNIYSTKLAFARELIQNSIDAISVRESKDTESFSKEILIELGNDEKGRRYFKITDRGTGMDRYKIERYFTSIGRSFYSGNEYDELGISYKPISNFGIGFLSCFMVCSEIDVRTRYYTDDSEGLKLHIPNYEGCFFVETDNDIEIGTEIKLYLKDIDESNKSIVDYICNVMRDIKYDINIKFWDKNMKERKIYIKSHAVRKEIKPENYSFFVPFSESGDISTVNYNEEILNNSYIDKYAYGLLIRNKYDLKAYNTHLVLNSGIAIERASLSSVFGKNIRKNGSIYSYYEGTATYNDIILNFPSNWFELDVARENITKVNGLKVNLVKVKIANCLYNQISEYIKYIEGKNTNIPAICLQDVIQYGLDFCGKKKSEKELYEKLDSLRYIPLIEFTDNGIIYKIIKKENNKKRK